MNKEQVYDEKIAPLMTQIIEVAKEHGIGFMAHFAIPTPEDDGLACTTNIPDGEGEFPESCKLATAAVMRGRNTNPLMLTTHHADGSKTLTAVLG